MERRRKAQTVRSSRNGTTGQMEKRIKAPSNRTGSQGNQFGRLTGEPVPCRRSPQPAKPKGEFDVSRFSARSRLPYDILQSSVEAPRCYPIAVSYTHLTLP